MNAAAGNNEKMVKLLLSYAVNPHLKDHFGDNAADYARSQGHEQLAVFLENLKQEGK
jgi:ankyrin repeat protein